MLQSFQKMINIEDIVNTLNSKLDETADVKVIDESSKHEGHLEFQQLNGISHVFIEITWNGFKELSLLKRQRIINEWLEIFFKQGLHSVRYKLKTYEEQK
jgi:stress-induced morphogen